MRKGGLPLIKKMLIPLRRRRPLGWLVLSALFAGACTVGPNYHPLAVTTRSTWASLDHAGTSAVGPLPADVVPTTRPSVVVEDATLPDRWWGSLGDPTLNTLVEQAARSNLNLAVAAARVRSSRAALAGAEAGLFPSGKAGAFYQYDRGLGPLFPVETGDYRADALGFDASWELDLFGGVRRGVESAAASEQAQVESRRDALVTLTAEVCRDYVELRVAQRRAAISLDDLHIAQQLLDLAQRQRAVGISGDLDVVRARAQVTSTAAALPALDAQAQQLIHAIGVLLGGGPDEMMASLSTPEPIPQTPAILPVGLPSTLLRRRPDVREVERELAAATAAIGVAESDLYPQISLVGGLGVGGFDGSNPFTWSSRAVTIGPTARWQLFDAGHVLANVDAKRAVRAELLADYRQTILSALRDVEDAIIVFDREQQRHELYRRTVDDDDEAVRIATDQYTNGVTSFLNLLDAQRSLFMAQDQLAQSDGAVAADLVSLYKSLGGGWQSLEHAPPEPEPEPHPFMPAAQLAVQ